MKFHLLAILILQTVALCPSASAQTSGQSDYALLLGPDVSDVMAGGGSSGLSLGPADTFKDSDDCEVTFRRDGLAVCFVDSSCAADAKNLPLCSLFFSAPSGLVLSDVVALTDLSERTNENGARGLREVPGLSQGVSPQVAYEVLKKRLG